MFSQEELDCDAWLVSLVWDSPVGRDKLCMLQLLKQGKQNKLQLHILAEAANVIKHTH